MDFLELFGRLSLALAVGLLIGLERGWTEREEKEGGRTAGLRTFGLTGLLGGLLAAISPPENFAVLAVGLLMYSAILAVFRWREAKEEQTYGITTIVAGMITLMLGAYSILGDPRITAAAAVACAFLLALKPLLHQWLRRLTWLELRAVLTLLTMTLILLPLLPDRPIDPWGAINPRSIWLLTIMIACISFVGYAAVRIAGERYGIEIVAVAGGLIASTAVTLAFAHLAAQRPANAPTLAYGALLSSSIMMFRVLLIATFVQPLLFGELVLPLLAAGAVLGLSGRFGVIGSTAKATDAQQLRLTNPIEIVMVLQFGALFVGLLLATKFVMSKVGDLGLLWLAAIVGTTDVDAFTLSVSQMTKNDIQVQVAAQAILAVVVSNSIAKVVMASVVGGRAFAVRMVSITAAALAAGATAYVLA